MTENGNPLISIVIPARNEQQDIGDTLETCLALDYAPKEIIVVDDSTDRTPQIVAGYAHRGVRLIHRERNSNGCCGARNLGMQTARGEIIVIFNSDNRPAPDFIQRLLAHYRAGADYVVVQSVVQNRQVLWSRFIWAVEREGLSKGLPLEWSEGFSCRRAAAEAVGYIPGDFPVPFCRDWRFGQALHDAGYTKHTDLSIEMGHVAPGTLGEYWRIQVWKGTHIAPTRYYFGRLSLPVIALIESARALRTLASIVLVVPVAWREARYARHAEHPIRELAGFWVAQAVQSLAQTVGAFRGLATLARAEGWRGPGRLAG